MSTDSAKSLRIRADLWNAVLDYSSGKTYYWKDGDVITSNAQSRSEELSRLPTVSVSEYTEWKKEFAGKNEHMSPYVKQRLSDWSEKNLPTAVLPGPLRGPWNGELKQRVRSRLREWFDASSIPLPADWLGSASSPEDTGDRSLTQLREVVIECVRIMTYEELARLEIPALVVVRVKEQATRGV